MLTISSFTYKATTGVAPYTYSWTSSNPCISFSQDKGVFDLSFTTDIFAAVDGCVNYGMDYNTLTLVDANGCKTEHLLYPTNPCATLNSTSIISSNGGLTHTVTPSGGMAPYSYQWTTSDTEYTKLDVPTGGDGSKVNMSIIKYAAIPRNWSVKLTVVITDAKGCTKTVERRVGLCGPVIRDVFADANCLPKKKSVSFKSAAEREFTTPPIQFRAEICGNCDISWDKTEFYPPNPNITIEVYDNPIRFKFNGIKSSDFKNGVLTIPYTVTDCNSVESAQANLILTQGPCFEELDGCPLIVNNLCTSSCEDLLNIDLEGLIVSPNCCDDNDIDWGSLQVDPLTPTDPSIVTINGLKHSLLFDRKTALYSPGAPPKSDVIFWSIKDRKGNHSGTKYIQIAKLCAEPPTLLPDCYFVNAADFQYELDVLANDPGPNLDPDTLMMLTYPTHGTAFVLNGKIYYTPYSGYIGTDTFQYKVANTDGIFASTTVTLNMVNSTPGEIQSCLIDPDTFGNIVVDQLVDDSGGFNVSLYGGINNNGTLTALSFNDEIEFDVLVNNVVTNSATLLVGTNMKTVVKGGTDNNWLTGTNFSQWITSNLLNPVTLLTGDNFRFDKKGWAFATGNVNEYSDLTKPGVQDLDATEVTFRIRVKDVSTGNDSGYAADIVPLVKKFAFEDTTHTDVATNANFAGEWAWVPGFVGTWDNCVSDCVCAYHGVTTNNHLMTVYSELNSTTTFCTKTIIEYKKVGQPAQTTNLTINKLTAEADMESMLNTLDARWVLDYQGFDEFATAPNLHNLWGHQAQFLVSNYLTVTEPGLEYFIMEYTPLPGEDMTNAGKRIKCTIDSRILF